MHRRPRIGLGQHQEAWLACDQAYFRRQCGKRQRALATGLAQDAKARAGNDAQNVFGAVGKQIVFAVAEQREIAIVQPLQECTVLDGLSGILRRRIAPDIDDRLNDALR